MSTLPKGTKAAAAFAERAIVAGVTAIALSKFSVVFAIPILGAILKKALEEILEEYLAEPTVSEQTKYALAGAWAEDRGAFDKRFIYLKTLEKQNASPAVIEKAIQDAEKDMEKFVRRGPIE